MLQPQAQVQVQEEQQEEQPPQVQQQRRPCLPQEARREQPVLQQPVQPEPQVQFHQLRIIPAYRRRRQEWRTQMLLQRLMDREDQVIRQIRHHRSLARRSRRERNRLLHLILEYSQEQEQHQVVCRELEHRAHILEGDLEEVRRGQQNLRARLQRQAALANQETRYQDNLEHAVNPHMEAYLQEQGVETDTGPDTDTIPEDQEQEEESESD
jgi:hypothetical protein